MIDAKTGWEILSGLRYRLPECPYCSATNVASYTQKMYGHWCCDECGRQLSALNSLLHHISSRVSLDTLQHKIDVWQAKKGLVVPSLLAKALVVYAEKDAALPEIRHAVKQTYTDKCKYCGEVSEIQEGADRCLVCAMRYRTYRTLSARITTLDEAEQLDLHQVLDEYVDLMKKGRWAPNIPKVRQKLKDQQ